MIDKADEGQEDGLAGGGLDDCGFAHAGCVEIDIGAFFCSFFLNIKVEELNDISD